MIAADMYELSPMQQGMLYHTLEAEGAAMYSVVVAYRLHGPLDAAAFARAWQLVVARHPILRTSFHWRDRTEPIQIVHAAAHIDVRRADWRTTPPGQQRQRLDGLLESEARQRFDLEKPPLMRLWLIRCREDVHEFVLAHHHLLMDGSCKPLLFKEVFAFYEALRSNETIDSPPATPYRAFIEWLREQDLGDAERFWREELSGVHEPTKLWAAPRAAQAKEEYAEERLEVSDEASEALRRFARRHRLTLNTIVTGAWALLLGRASGSQSVVFGATVNGRPPMLDGAESILGLFINTLPVRVRIDPAESTVEWLRRLQARQAAARDYDFTPLSQIRQWCSMPRGLPLFESLVVFENNVGYGLASERYGEIEIGEVRPLIRNSFPITVRCVPGPALSIQVLYDTSRFSADTIERIAGDLVALLDDVSRNAHQDVASMVARLGELERARTTRQARAFDSAAQEKLRRLKQERRTVRMPR
jgi:hypothetical protein